MTVLRRVARPLLASAFIADGIDAVVHPDAHTGALRDLEPQLAKASDGVPLLPKDARTIVRISGAVTATSGVLLAAGIAPRVAAGVLAAVQVPTILLVNPFWAARGEERKTYLRGALRGASLLGGLLLATADTAGKPSLAWRWEHSRAEAAKHKAELEKVREQVTRRQARAHHVRRGISDAASEVRHTTHDVADAAKDTARYARKAAKRRADDVGRALHDALPG
ncbi:DoxX family protein [Beutenbergia cavernae DSM 12333]|uniref:DoxX family protein n=1 Tax=Beutenbergia cavernae (strain ATCC BAA-8 / DSM 12333 / CCUG 43141 / JCM 11478 / NBRC 16432 / NCIMB 13614 / HKI 0122) TaxID=471853 RepID=C5C1Q6_BEUC1|nr:DoxX family protein [Beutenbergia cavernae]ACQ79524.1 DoxX family protein [Beutenbergia cavernae DSM 12333]